MIKQGMRYIRQRTAEDAWQHLGALLAAIEPR